MNHDHRKLGDDQSPLTKQSAAYEPRMLLAVLLYAYCSGVRSSRQIERRCQEDIAFRILSGNRAPDHVTIARFRVRHEQALAGLLVVSLKLCAAAGMVRLGLVALDGTYCRSLSMLRRWLRKGTGPPCRETSRLVHHGKPPSNNG